MDLMLFLGPGCTTGFPLRRQGDPTPGWVGGSPHPQPGARPPGGTPQKSGYLRAFPKNFSPLRAETHSRASSPGKKAQKIIYIYIYNFYQNQKKGGKHSPGLLVWFVYSSKWWCFLGGSCKMGHFKNGAVVLQLLNCCWIVELLNFAGGAKCPHFKLLCFLFWVQNKQKESSKFENAENLHLS